MEYKQPKGQILLFGPSFSGKSFIAQKFRQMGLQAFDLEKEGSYIRWCNDRDGKPVKRRPKHKLDKWLATHHFLMDKPAVKEFLSKKKDCIVLAHSWNIMECLDLFTQSYYLYLNDEELEQRMQVQREDHSIPSMAQIAFMKQKHKDRYEDVKVHNIPLLDATKTSEEIYAQIINMQKT